MDIDSVKGERSLEDCENAPVAVEMNAAMASGSALERPQDKSIFLDLPGEIKNAIYDIATADSITPARILPQASAEYIRLQKGFDDEDGFRIPRETRDPSYNHSFLGLTQVNKKIRSEFRPLYMRRTQYEICIDHIAEWETTFLPEKSETELQAIRIADSAPKDIESIKEPARFTVSPGKLDILLPPCAIERQPKSKDWVKSPEYKGFNLMPLIKLKHYTPHFSIRFAAVNLQNVNEKSIRPNPSLETISQSSYNRIAEDLTSVVNSESATWHSWIKKIFVDRVVVFMHLYQKTLNRGLYVVVSRKYLRKWGVYSHCDVHLAKSNIEEDLEWGMDVRAFHIKLVQDEDLA